MKRINPNKTLSVALGFFLALAALCEAREPVYTRDMAMQHFAILADGDGREIQVLTISEIRPLGERSGTVTRTLFSAPRANLLTLTTTLEPSTARVAYCVSAEGSPWSVELIFTVGLPAADYDTLLAIETARDSAEKEKFGVFPIVLKTNTGEVIENREILGDIEPVLQKELAKSSDFAAWLKNTPSEIRKSLQWLVAAELADRKAVGRIQLMENPLIRALSSLMGPVEVGPVTFKESKSTVGRTTALPAALELVSQFKSLENNDPLPTAEIDAQLKRLASQPPRPQAD